MERNMSKEGPLIEKQDLNRLRNAIHNEASVTKQDIRDMVEQAIERLVDKRVKQLLPDKLSMDRLVDSAIGDRTDYWYNENPVKFNDMVQRKVAIELVKKLNIAVKDKKS